jgi:hypothetical protein
VDGDGRSSGNIATLNLACLRLIGGVVVLKLNLLGLFVGDFLNAGVGHGCSGDG